MSKIQMHYSSKKFVRSSIVILAIVLSSYVMYQIQRAVARNKTHAEITNLIVQYKNGETQTIDLSKISHFSWDKLYVFGPYDWIDAIQDKLGYPWRPDNDKFGELESARTFNYLVFTLEGRVVQYVEYPIELCNFSTVTSRTIGYKPDEAIFVINKNGSLVWLSK